MKNKTTIDSLKVQLAEVNEWRVKLIDEISEQEDNLKMPALIKKHVGKFYKYRNSFGNKENGWWMYSHCIGVNNSNEGIFNTFQVSPDRCEFKIKDLTGFHLCERLITKREYTAAFRKFLAAVNRLKP